MLEHEDHDMMRPFRVLPDSDGDITDGDASSDLQAPSIQ